ncbi:MAG: cyanophycin synthetase [bacterium]
MYSSIYDIENYLQGLIPKATLPQYPGEKGIARTKEFLHLLGSPQNTLKVVHIAGTSGKGSTSFTISNLLVSQGFKVGLHLSPHLLDIRERTEINNILIAEKKYCEYFNAIVPSIEKMRESVFWPITYFEALVGFTYYVFAREKVDYAIMEVGLGGEFDGTNCVERKDKLAVLSKVGFDHMNVLGTTLRKIAHQKAAICQMGGDMITIYQPSSAYDEIQKIVHQKKAHLFTVERSSITHIKLSPKHTSFSFAWGSRVLKNYTLGLIGDHQAQNAALAIATLCYLSKRDKFNINQEIAISMLKTLRFKGRFDILSQNNNHIILDGAHNVQKMRALLKTVRKLYPNKKFTFVLAFKRGKEYQKMVELIIPFAERMVITHIFSDNQDLHHFSVPPNNIIEEIKRLGFSRVVVKNNIADIIKMMQQESSSFVVSGSLYLLGDIYKLLKKAV